MSQLERINGRRIIGRITSAENGIRVQASKRNLPAQARLASRAERDLTSADRAMSLPATSSRQ